MSTEKSACQIQPTEPWAHGESAPTESVKPRVEPIPEELLRICEPLRKRADALMEEANALHFRAEGLAESIRITIGTGMKMLPVDTFDLDAGTVTRGAATEEGKP